ncbi:hypothetical protein [Bradyrhizobium sp. AZCC 2230]|uniref:hypothetical protein n=1 Tax=Bradyrhizobium sp. AZCC 2230 TaxID=3117021 RepID=UPI002FF2588C
MGSEPMVRSRSSFPKLASNGLDVHLAAPGSFRMRPVVFRSNSDSACVQYVCPVVAAIEYGCSIGANPAQNNWLSRLVTPASFRERTIQSGPSTFQQALYANLS